jgi:hypothetical protein
MILIPHEMFPELPHSHLDISIENFYEKLRDIVSGKRHWLFPDTFTENVHDYLTLASEFQKKGAQDDWPDEFFENIMRGVQKTNVNIDVVRNTVKSIGKWEFQYVHKVMMTLAIGTSSMDLAQYSRWVSGGIHYFISSSETGQLVSVNRFLGVYWRLGRLDHKRTEYVPKAFTILMKCFHKNISTDTDAFWKALADIDSMLDKETTVDDAL